MLKVACQSPGFMNQLLDLVHTTWNEQSVPKDWTDAVLIPIPKKGDLSNCDNWKGILLLEVVGKVIHPTGPSTTTCRRRTARVLVRFLQR